MKLPQLTLRDLFWLVALVAMGCGWWVDRARLTQQIEEKRFWSMMHGPLPPNIKVVLDNRDFP